MATLTVALLVCVPTLATAQAAPGGSAGGVSGPVRAGAEAVVHASFALRSRVVAARPAEPGDHLQVSVGDKTYSAPTSGSWACSTGVWVLQLERNSLDQEPDGSNVYPLCSAGDASALRDTLVKIGDEQITVVNSLNRGPGGDSRTLPGLGEALAKIGVPARQFAAVDLARTAFSVFGIPGLSPGQAYTATQPLAEEADEAAGSATAASINGTLALDNHANFTLTMQDFATYDITADGAITINDHSYPVPARMAGFAGGFHVLIVNRRTLAPVSDTLYATNNNPGEQYRMGRDLARLTGADEQSVLLLVATVGNPVGGNQLPPGPINLPAPCVGSAAFTVTCAYQPTGKEQDGSEQQFTVPGQVGGYPVAHLQVGLQGGYGNQADDGGQGGNPDRVAAELPVGADASLKPGQNLYVEVGGAGAGGGRTDGGPGGWNGGGSGGGSDRAYSYGWPGGGGGGASDLRTVSRAGAGGNSAESLASRLVVAAGGGGAGGDSRDSGAGGNGGDAGSSGYNGVHGTRSTGGGGGGYPGTATHGGAAGTGARTDVPAAGLGVGGAGSYTQDPYGASGGGGGGYYGGGGGGVTIRGGGGAGGGGGSNLVPAGGTSEPVTTHELASVSISYQVPYGTLGAALRPFGATPSVINALGTSPRYALAGVLATPENIAGGLSLDSPEASPQIVKGATGQLQGVLQRGHQNMWYSSVTSNAPVIRSRNGNDLPPSVTNYGLYHAIAQASTDWPVPAPGPAHQAQQNALTYLSQQACGDSCPNIRDEYNADPNIIGAWQLKMDPNAGVPYSSGHGFDRSAFDAVKEQLYTELGDVHVVDGLKAGMHTLLSDQQQMLQPALKQAYSDVRESVPELDDPTRTAVSVVSFILELLTIAAEAAGQHEIGAALGIVNAILKVSTELANEPNGDGKDQLSTTVDKLGDQTAGTFAAALTSLSQTFSYLYEDWGKLSAVADGLVHHESEWDVAAGDAGQYVTAATNAVKLGYYRALVPLAYNHRTEAQGAPTDNLDQWCWHRDITRRGVCDSYASDRILGFTYPASVYSVAVQTPALNFKPAHDNILVYRDPDPIRALPTELMKQMTESGLYPPYLFLRWPLKHSRTCPIDSIFDVIKSSDFTCAANANDGLEGQSTVTTQALPVATVGQPYRAVLTATGGDGGYHWILPAGSTLPAGITLSSGGVLSGTPTTAGQYRFAVTVGDPATATLHLTVRAASPAVSSPAPPPPHGPAFDAGALAPPHGLVLTNAGAPAPPPGPALADTGVHALPRLVVAGLLLLLTGALLTMVRKRP